jgi:hypothetical protein
MKRVCHRAVVFIGLVVALLGLTQAASARFVQDEAAGGVTVEFGKSIDPAVRSRISFLLRPFLTGTHDCPHRWPAPISSISINFIYFS